MSDEAALWQPSAQAISDAPLTAFMSYCATRYSLVIDDYDAFHQWSVTSRATFWSALWDFAGVVGDKGKRDLVDGNDMLAARFFPDAMLNFAENLLAGATSGEAIVFRTEDHSETRWSWQELEGCVSRLQQAFRAAGIRAGDRVAAMMPNMPETVAAMLAATSIGAVWASCAPELGVTGVLDRFGQIEPCLFICCDSYWYNGERQDVADKALEVAKALSVHCLVVPLAGGAEEMARSIENAQTLEDFIAPFSATAITFERLPFSHPIYILFSSGTSDTPDCIVHSAGGVLLQHIKEHRLHCSLRSGDRLFFLTTCGSMMWNWLVSGLASGATLCLYDGSPFAPGVEVLFDYAAAERFSVFGASAQYFDFMRKEGCRPRDRHDLAALKLITSTGAPLSPEGFDYVYGAIKSNVQLASISGGTDILSCFVLGIPIKAVYKGEIQGPGLGLAVEVFDQHGQKLRGGKGQLVCTKAFPGMPVGFCNDPDGAKYKATYFSSFENVWCHGDCAERTAHEGFIIHGSSNATPNPEGCE